MGRRLAVDVARTIHRAIAECRSRCAFTQDAVRAGRTRLLCSVGTTPLHVLSAIALQWVFASGLWVGPPPVVPEDGVSPAPDPACPWREPACVEEDPCAATFLPRIPRPEECESPDPVVTSPPPPTVAVVDHVPPPPAERPAVLLESVLGVIAALVLAYLAGSPRARRLAASIGISEVAGPGLLFLLMGVVARHPAVGILDDTLLDDLRPALHLGLGWLGLLIGLNVDLGSLGRLPRGTAGILSVGTAVPVLVITAVCGSLLFGSSLVDSGDPLDSTVLRDAIIIGTAGATAAETASLGLALRGGSARSVEVLTSIIRLEQLASLVGLLFLCAYFRPDASAVTWQLPGTAWVLLTLGLAVAMGLLVHSLVLLPGGRAETTALLLGSVAFASGLASELRLSPLVVCFVSGVLLASFPGDRVALRDELRRLEPPIYLTFLVVAGALWDPGGLTAWIGMLGFVAARLFGRYLGVQVAWRRWGYALTPAARRALAFAPLGPLPIAIVVNAQLFYTGDRVPTLVTIVIAGSFVTEAIVQLYWRSRPPEPTTEEG